MARRTDAEKSLKSLAGTKPLDLSGKLAFYKLDAEERADELGHALGEWKEQGGWFESTCSLCGLKVGVADAPMKGKQRVNGDAVERSCT